MTIRLSKRTLLVVVCVIALLVAGGSFASWSVSTSGTGYAKAGSATALVLSDASASTTGDLYPGGTGSLKIKVANPNSFPVRITAVSLTSGGTITSTVAACDSGGNGVSFANQSGLALDLAANASATVFTLSGSVSMASSAANPCQGAIFSVPVDVTATSN